MDLPGLHLLSRAAEGLMTLITPWAALPCTSEAACGQGERSSGRKSRSGVHFQLRSCCLHIYEDYPAHPNHVRRLIKLNISHRVHEVFTCFSPARVSTPPPSFPLLYGNCS